MQNVHCQCYPCTNAPYYIMSRENKYNDRLTEKRMKNCGRMRHLRRVGCVMVLMLFCLGAFPAEATDENREKMMWRGTITMEITERHAYDIKKTNPKSGTWSQRTKKSVINHTATIRVISADPLGNGDVKISGPVSSVRQIIKQARFKSGCNSSYNVERMEGQAHGDLNQGVVNIFFIKKSQIEGAKGIEQAVLNCGTDQTCLAKIYDRYKSLLEDKSGSFPIQMTIQCIPQCTGSGNTTKQMESTGCNGETESDENSGSFPIYCVPMAFEIKDGTYTRGEQGDRITGTFFKNEKIPYTGPDGQIYPRDVTARCVVNLTNGPPELKIYMATESGYEDITDKEQDILVAGHP